VSNQEPRKTSYISIQTRVFDTCPHCGRDLSPWERVLLSVDRALMCKHCWYRIILDTPPESPSEQRDLPSEESK
jgi:DNA-directed RNA polymerase subunit RPC12/RpoP